MIGKVSKKSDLKSKLNFMTGLANFLLSTVTTGYKHAARTDVRIRGYAKMRKKI